MTKSEFSIMMFFWMDANDLVLENTLQNPWLLCSPAAYNLTILFGGDDE